MPGVNTTTTVRQGPPSQAVVEGNTYFVVGLTERGPTDTAVVINSMAQYATMYGDRTSYSTIFDDLQTFFEEGGSQACIVRVIGPSPTAGTLVLNDGASTPLPTLTINASSAGPWSSRISVQVEAGTVADTFSILVYEDNVLVDRFRNIASPAEAVTRLANSTYVRAVNSASATAPPNNNPAVKAKTVLSTGVDGRGSLVAADYVAALDTFGTKYGSGVVAIPTFPSSSVGAGLLAHCTTHNRIFLTRVDAGSAPTDAKAATAALIPDGPGGEYGGLIFPSVLIPDGSGGTRTIGPEGYTAACRSRSMLANGHPNQPPAGKNAQAKFVVGVDYDVDRATGDDLDGAQVSAIRVISDTVRLYGWRSLAQPTDVAAYPLLSYRDLLNFVQVQADEKLEDFVFSNVDAQGQLLKRLQGALIGLVQPIADLGALFPLFNAKGQLVDPGYTVDTGSTVNTTQTLTAQQLGAVLGLRPAPTATVINLNIVMAALTAAL